MFVDPLGLIIALPSAPIEPQRDDYKNDKQYYLALRVYQTELAIHNFNMTNYWRAIEYLMQCPVFAELYIHLMNSKETYYIAFTDRDTGYYDFLSRTVHWNPVLGADMNGRGDFNSAAMVLAHEMGHAGQQDGYFGDKIKETVRSYVRTNKDDFRDELENHNMPFHNTVAINLGEPTRDRYTVVTFHIMENSTDFGKIDSSGFFTNRNNWSPRPPVPYTPLDPFAFLGPNAAKLRQ